MNYIKTLALLISLSTLASCTEAFEDCPEDVYSTIDIKDTKASESNDSTGGTQITILIDETEVVDIDCTLDIP